MNILEKKYKNKLMERKELILSMQNNNVFIVDENISDVYVAALNKLNIDILELENKLYGNIQNKKK